jgi:hypothetical protein
VSENLVLIDSKTLAIIAGCKPSLQDSDQESGHLETIEACPAGLDLSLAPLPNSKANP